MLALHWETALLFPPDSAGGYSEQTFKALAAPYVHCDNLLPTLLCSVTALLACGNYFITASISAVMNTTGKQFKGKVVPLTSLAIMTCMLNVYAATFPCLEKRDAFKPLIHAHWDVSGVCLALFYAIT